MGKKTEKKEKEAEVKQELVELEQFVVNSKINNSTELVEQRKEEIVELIDEYKGKFTEVKFTKDGIPIPCLNTRPYLVSSYFFKSINPLGSIEPEYSPEKLAIVFDLYLQLVEQVNAYICDFSPTKTHFCKFAGISTSTLDRYKNSPILGMRNIVEKIYDECFDSSLTLAQHGKLKSNPTLFRAKSELEVTEKVQPKVNINANIVDIESIKERIANLQLYDIKKNQ